MPQTGGYIDDTIIITFWITGVVFTAVVLFMAYCVFRFRIGRVDGPRTSRRAQAGVVAHRRDRGGRRGHVGSLACSCGSSSSPSRTGRPSSRWWASSGSGASGSRARTAGWAADTENVSPDNPLGLSPDDPYGQDDVIIEGDDLHLPVGKPVKVLLRSIDVLHDFYVPEFRAKMDMVPGMVTYFWLTPTRTGTFEILCFELCGLGHPDMRGMVVVEEESDYQAWLQEPADLRAACRLEAEQLADARLESGSGCRRSE